MARQCRRRFAAAAANAAEGFSYAYRQSKTKAQRGFSSCCCYCSLTTHTHGYTQSALGKNQEGGPPASFLASAALRSAAAGSNVSSDSSMKKDLSRSPSLTHALCTWWRIITKNGILFSRRRQQQQRQRRNVRLFVVVVVAAVLFCCCCCWFYYSCCCCWLSESCWEKYSWTPQRTHFVDDARFIRLGVRSSPLLPSPLTKLNGCGAQKTLNSIKSSIHTYNVTNVVTHTICMCVCVRACNVCMC